MAASKGKDPLHGVLVSETFVVALFNWLSDPARAQPGEDGYAWWVARLVFLVEDELERVVSEERTRLKTPSKN